MSIPQPRADCSGAVGDDGGLWSAWEGTSEGDRRLARLWCDEKELHFVGIKVNLDEVFSQSVVLPTFQRCVEKVQSSSLRSSFVKPDCLMALRMTACACAIIDLRNRRSQF